MAVDIPTDCPKSVRNRCVIEVFSGIFVLSFCYFVFSVGVRAFVIGLSRISSHFSLLCIMYKIHFMYICDYNPENGKSMSQHILTEKRNGVLQKCQ